MQHNAVNAKAYRHTQVATAGRGQLIVLLYDEMIKQIDIALENMHLGIQRFDTIHNAIIKAHDISTELMVALNMNTDGKMARNLFDLYSFFCARLMDANLKKEREPLEEIRPLVAELRATWSKIVEETPSVDHSENGGIDIKG